MKKKITVEDILFRRMTYTNLLGNAIDGNGGVGGLGNILRGIGLFIKTKVVDTMIQFNPISVIWLWIVGAKLKGLKKNRVM